MEIQWYPGHMTKAKRQMQEDLKLIDLIIELLDARVPAASRNPDISALGRGKSRLFILNKADLADERVTEEWEERFREDGVPVMTVDSRNRADLRIRSQRPLDRLRIDLGENMKQRIVTGCQPDRKCTRDLKTRPDGSVRIPRHEDFLILTDRSQNHRHIPAGRSVYEKPAFLRSEQVRRQPFRLENRSRRRVEIVRSVCLRQICREYPVAQKSPDPLSLSPLRAVGGNIKIRNAAPLKRTNCVDQRRTILVQSFLLSHSSVKKGPGSGRLPDPLDNPHLGLFYLISWIHPSGASMRPIWIPVSVSYSFWMTGPIFSIPDGKQISFP